MQQPAADIHQPGASHLFNATSHSNGQMPAATVAPSATGHVTNGTQAAVASSSRDRCAGVSTRVSVAHAEGVTELPNAAAGANAAANVHLATHRVYIEDNSKGSRTVPIPPPPAAAATATAGAATAVPGTVKQFPPTGALAADGPHEHLKQDANGAKKDCTASKRDAVMNDSDTSSHSNSGSSTTSSGSSSSSADNSSTDSQATSSSSSSGGTSSEGDTSSDGSAGEGGSGGTHGTGGRNRGKPAGPNIQATNEASQAKSVVAAGSDGKALGHPPHASSKPQQPKTAIASGGIKAAGRTTVSANSKVAPKDAKHASSVKPVSASAVPAATAGGSSKQRRAQTGSDRKINADVSTAHKKGRATEHRDVAADTRGHKQRHSAYQHDTSTDRSRVNKCKQHDTSRRSSREERRVTSSHRDRTRSRHRDRSKARSRSKSRSRSRTRSRSGSRSRSRGHSMDNERSHDYSRGSAGGRRGYSQGQHHHWGKGKVNGGTTGGGVTRHNGDWRNRLGPKVNCSGSYSRSPQKHSRHITPPGRTMFQSVPDDYPDFDDGRIFCMSSELLRACSAANVFVSDDRHDVEAVTPETMVLMWDDTHEELHGVYQKDSKQPPAKEPPGGRAYQVGAHEAHNR